MPKAGGGGLRTSLVGIINSMFSRSGQPRDGYFRGTDLRNLQANPTNPMYSWGADANWGQPISRFMNVFQPNGGLFSPGLPLQPVEPEYTRRWDFPTGYNLQYTPRSYEPIGFEELRFLAKEDITALCIETRKDQIAKLHWSIKPKDEDKPSKKGSDKRIDMLTEWWEFPNNEDDFATWLRAALHEVLVTDAPAFEPMYNRAGELIGIDVVDGATIKVLLDDTGRRPIPPAPAYEQIIHGRPWVLLEDGSKVNVDDDQEVGERFTSQELIYFPRNKRVSHVYGFSPCEQAYLTINTSLRRGIMQLQYFTESNVPRGILSGVNEWTPEQLAQYQDWLDDKVAGNTAERTRLILAPQGVNYQPIREPPYKDDFDDWRSRVICFAFNLPPTAFVRPQNRATAQTQSETSSQEGLAPLMNWVKRLIDGVIQRRMGFDDLEFAWSDDQDPDPKDQATILIGYVKEGIYTRNEARDVLGMDPIDGGDDATVDTTQGPVLVRDLEDASEQVTNPPLPPMQAAAPNGAPASSKAPGKGVVPGKGQSAGKAPTGQKAKPKPKAKEAQPATKTASAHPF